MSHSQFSLLKTRRFLPLFLTQALGAFNDNVFKNALVILITYSLAQKAGMSAQLLVTAAAFTHTDVLRRGNDLRVFPRAAEFAQTVD